ncbi:hypothetical protein BDK51DRAFT_51134 [Blyttiomyces helicus]|uniref:Uncharacterized protein n=1 Tax=Blyttiomyces helicus TaxID=388810 RepID=A0A4P9W7S9_9FUNG|nr:hypothetical protein BDK51DRAFT_51134 [Blyttiomyces helicus]|eukprot:RKO88434.1 hypothetical protein BDK51DRAFT_51134 [Blyttiomyces helicus]
MPPELLEFNTQYQPQPAPLPFFSPSGPEPVGPLAIGATSSQQSFLISDIAEIATNTSSNAHPLPSSSPIFPEAEHLPHFFAPPPSSPRPPPPTPGPKPRHLRVPRNLKRLNTIDELASCTSCHKPTVTLLLHGPASAFTTPHAMSLTCRPCDAAAALERSTLVEVADTALTLKKKKRPRGVEGPLFCKRLCGGGGEFRTGRWRPNELFSPNRKLFNLSHDRIGTLAFTREVFICPNSLSPSLVSTMIAFREETTNKRCAEAKFPEGRIGMSEFAKFKARVHESSEEEALRMRDLGRPRCDPVAQTSGRHPPPADSNPGRQMVQVSVAEWWLDDRIAELSHQISDVDALEIACEREIIVSMIADVRALSVLAPEHAVCLQRPTAAELEKDGPDASKKLGGGGLRCMWPGEVRREGGGREVVRGDGHGGRGEYEEALAQIIIGFKSQLAAFASM